MQISQADWNKYRKKQASLCEEAADKMVEWLESKGGYININTNEIVSYAYALSTKYGEGTASLAAQMYDDIARVSKKELPSAEVAQTASLGEIKRAVNAVTENVTTDKNVASVVSKSVKQAGADTMLKNAIRDGAQFAWVPGGDECAYCLMIASKGWQNASKSVLSGNHAEHIHPNCMCEFVIRFDKDSGVKGYDPTEYKKVFEDAEGKTSSEKLNSIRRIQYQENKDKINAQKRENYAAKTQMNYRSERDSNNVISRITNEGAITAQQIIGSPNGLYVSDLLEIKPKKLQEIENNVTEAKKYIGVEGKQEPTIIIVSDTEIGNAGGRYNAETNTLYYKVIIDQDLQKHVNYHELFHWNDAQEYIKKGNTIESNQQLIDYQSKKAKEKLDKIGINSDNVGNISNYAFQAYKQGRFDEVYTEYRTVEALKR